jgi:hypothetical protein
MRSEPFKSRRTADSVTVYAGVKTRARALRRFGCAPVKIENPNKFLHSSRSNAERFKQWQATRSAS